MRKAEKYIKDFTNRCSNRLTFGGNAPWVSPENALEAVKIEREELIKKICEWIKEHYLEYPNEDKTDTQRFIKDLKNDMS